MCGGFVGNLIKNPVKATSNALSRVDDLARQSIKPTGKLLQGDFKGFVDEAKNMVKMTADTVGLGGGGGSKNDVPAPSSPDIAAQSDQANADASALSAAYKSRRRRAGAYSLFQAGPVLQQLAGAAPKATLLGG